MIRSDLRDADFPAAILANIWIGNLPVLAIRQTISLANHRSVDLVSQHVMLERRVSNLPVFYALKTNTCITIQRQLL